MKVKARNEIQTNLGKFLKDQAGLWHYDANGGVHVDDAARDAIQKRPGVAIFWHNDTYAPIFRNDKSKNLVRRWEEWRLAFQNNSESLNANMLSLRTGK